ncbi:hypothetical protein C4579_03680 [Candidatus Microgenomates bacterium]|nr:MAG: hypothetical protein C4579_03680 [Candidatus Microgenomates bacterium]
MNKINSSDWRVKTMSRIRKLIAEADPEVKEEMKYKTPSNPAGIPVWYHDGMITTGETYKQHLRFTFAKGSILREKHDPNRLFNRHTAIVIQEDDTIDESAFKDLIRAAVKLNREKKSKKSEK